MLRARFTLAAAAALTALAIFAVACDGDDDDDSPAPTDSAGSPAATSGGDGNGASSAALSDEEYLAVFCSGLVEYQDAVNTESTEEGIQRVVEDYVQDLNEVSPPEDLQEFHSEYIAYLEDAVDEPTALLTSEPPLPDEGPRERLAGKVDDVPECEYPTFLSSPE